MTRTRLFILLLIFPLIHGCKQHKLEGNNKNGTANTENIEMISQQNENRIDSEDEDSYMLTIEEARQALLRKRDFNNEEEKNYRDFLEGYPDGKFDYRYEDYVVIEIISKWSDEDNEEERDIIEDDDFVIVSQFECNLKEGLFRNITNVGSTFGRFRKNKHGEWITTIEGGSGVGSYGSEQ